VLLFSPLGVLAQMGTSTMPTHTSNFSLVGSSRFNRGTPQNSLGDTNLWEDNVKRFIMVSRLEVFR
jgi:hypothetical protein